MKTLRLILVALLAACPLSVQTRAQTSEADGPQDAVFTITAQDIGVERSDTRRNIGGRLLFDRARYHAGDDPAWADPAFDDQHWEIASTGLPPDSLPRQGWPGIGWFRIRLRVDASLQNHDLGFVISHAGAVEAYLDGRLVYQSGTVGPTRAEEVPHVDWDPFVLPLEAGREHVLALRYSSFVTEGFRARWFNTGPGVYWGERATMMRHRGFVRFNQGGVSAFYLAFALLFGLLYGLYRSERLFLYLALFCGLLVPTVFIGGQLSFVHAPALVMPLVDAVFALWASASLAMLLVVYAFFYEARPRQFYGFLLLALAATIAIVVRLENLIYFSVFVLLCWVEALRVVVVALWRRKRWAWIIGVGFAPSIIILLWDQFERLGLLTTPWSSSPFSPNMIGMVFLSTAFAIYVGIRFAEANRGLAAANRELFEANRTLEDRVARRTAALKASQAQLIHSEKMASLGQLTSGIAHELKNPLNFVNNFAEVNEELARELKELITANRERRIAEVLEDLDDIASGVRLNSKHIAQHGKRADAIVQSMMDHARGGTGERYDVGVNKLVDEYVGLSYHAVEAQLPELQVEIERAYDEAVGTVEMAPQEIGRALMNLLNNAFEAVHQRSQGTDGYVPRVKVMTRQVGDGVEIRVCDNGPGIPAEIKDRIFEPFFTTKPTGSGTGLGLSLAYDIVTQGHGGTLTVESTEGEGATFVITLPHEAKPTDEVNSLS